MNFAPLASWSVAALLLAAACGRQDLPVVSPGITVPSSLPEPLRVALVSHGGEAGLDASIRAAQARVLERQDVPRLERLAALFINKARSSSDTGFYKQAEACAEAMQALADGEFAAALVRGHVRHALHDFDAAERIARDLVARRGMFLDLGLLGDVLVDLGRLDEASTAYQRMVDDKPCLQSYARVGHLRWLRGDLGGARELFALAASAGSRRDPESVAWVLCRQAALELLVGEAAAARRLAKRALELVDDYPVADAVLARSAWELGDAAAATASATAAAERSFLPEHQWLQAELLRASGRPDAAAMVEERLLQRGEREDPRTLALWLASSGRELGRALQLAEAELKLRQDPYTQDVVALARLRVGDLVGAAAAIEVALASGTRDPRVRMHAGSIALARGDAAQAERHLTVARACRAGLLPSERQELDTLLARL